MPAARRSMAVSRLHCLSRHSGPVPSRLGCSELVFSMRHLFMLDVVIFTYIACLQTRHAQASHQRCVAIATCDLGPSSAFFGPVLEVPWMVCSSQKRRCSHFKSLQVTTSNHCSLRVSGFRGFRLAREQEMPSCLWEIGLCAAATFGLVAKETRKRGAVTQAEDET